MKEFIEKALKSMNYDFSDVKAVFDETKSLYESCESNWSEGIDRYERQYIDNRMKETYEDLQDPFKAQTEETCGKVQDLLYSVIFLAKGEAIIKDYLSGDGIGKDSKQERINETVRSFIKSMNMPEISIS